MRFNCVPKCWGGQDGKWVSGWVEEIMRMREAVSSGTGKGNLSPDFSFPFLDDLCRLLICKIVMVYI
jgi:hypothetical protein